MVRYNYCPVTFLVSMMKNIQITMLLIALILIQNIHNTELSSNQCDYPRNHTWYVIGIYSACYHSNNRSELNLLAEKLDRTVEIMWSHGGAIRSMGIVYKQQINTTYLSFDICYNYSRLKRLIESIQLDEMYHYKAWSRKSNQTIHVSNVIAIYAEVPITMMNYLENSFPGDIRFLGKYVSFNTSIADGLFESYAGLLHKIITFMKWRSLLILDIQPSTMSRLYEIFPKKATENKLCVQYKTLKSPWNITLVSKEWLGRAKPAVITIGDKYGQVEVIKQLAIQMREANFTIPILAEGFNEDMKSFKKAQKNFDCFKNINSSFLTTKFSSFDHFDGISESEKDTFRNISDSVNETISVHQQFALKESSRLKNVFVNSRWGIIKCKCSLDFDCNHNRIKKSSRIFLRQWLGSLTASPINGHRMYVQVSILDPKQPFDQSTFDNYRRKSWWVGCRKYASRLIRDTKSLVLNQSAYHHYMTKCQYWDGKILDKFCWNGR